MWSQLTKLSTSVNLSLLSLMVLTAAVAIAKDLCAWKMKLCQNHVTGQNQNRNHSGSGCFGWRLVWARLCQAAFAHV
jgi:hypothetical protein